MSPSDGDVGKFLLRMEAVKFMVGRGGVRRLAGKKILAVNYGRNSCLSRLVSLYPH